MSENFSLIICRMEGDSLRVEIISKETVKPSSPTPPHLRHLKLSYLDQLARPVYFPIIFFFQSHHSDSLQISQHLKHSLSHALPLFHALAGRLRVDDNSVVDCNDAGVELIHARINACIADVMQAPAVEELKQFLPLDPTAAGKPGERAFFLFQLTFFACGGVAVGVCFSHQVADCATAMALINEWAAMCQTQSRLDILRYRFDLHKYFPPRVSMVPKFSPVASGEKFITRSFVFDKRKLMILKELASASTSSAPPVSNPTRAELVSGFIWRSFLKAGRMKGRESVKVRAAFHAVNLRPRLNSRVLDNVMGNGVMFSIAVGDVEEEEYGELIRRLRWSIKKIDEKYITSGDEYVNDHARYFCKGDVEFCSFSSWSMFPVYDVDFGWGKPAWCCTTALPAKNLTILMNSRGGEDIEAWVNMNEHNLEMLQTQFQLISATNS